jgi:hypothetical protein
MPGEKTQEELFEAIAAHATTTTALITALIATHPDRALVEQKFIEHFERHRTRYLFSDNSERLGELLEKMRAQAIEDIRRAT